MLESLPHCENGKLGTCVRWYRYMYIVGLRRILKSDDPLIDDEFVVHGCIRLARMIRSTELNSTGSEQLHNFNAHVT